MPLGQYMGPSISSPSIFVLFLSFLHKERNPVRAGGFQAATLFFMMQATVDIMDTTNPMQPIKKDGHSQKGLSLCHGLKIRVFYFLYIFQTFQMNQISFMVAQANAVLQIH